MATTAFDTLTQQIPTAAAAGHTGFAGADYNAGKDDGIIGNRRRPNDSSSYYAGYDAARAVVGAMLGTPLEQQLPGNLMAIIRCGYETQHALGVDWQDCICNQFPLD